MDGVETRQTHRASGRSATADWARALQRTADINVASTRTLATIVDENAIARPHEPALIGVTASLSYGDLGWRSNQYARWALAEGLQAGDRVALIMGNSPDYAAIWIGLGRVGVVTALINTHLVGAGLVHCIALAAPRSIIVDAAHLQMLEAADPDTTPILVHGFESARHRRIDHLVGSLSGFPLDAATAAAPLLGDPALLIYTSGTTGLPKAAHVSHYRVRMWSEWFAAIADARADDRLYNCLPMYHSIGGVVAIGSMLVAGGAVVLREGFSAGRFWPDVIASGATIFQYIGELCRYLLNAPEHEAERAHALRLCIGNGLRGDVWEPFERRFAIARIIEFYAATEGSFSLFNLEGKPGAIGRIPRFMDHRSPVALVRFDQDGGHPERGADGFCVRCRANEAGEAIGKLASEASSMATHFEGYTSEAESERKILRDVFVEGDRWFRTGDLMKRDQNGFFSFVDRIGDTFRWKGENVATAEVADALCACDGVLEATVYGVAVPSAEGRAGMAALVVAPSFDVAVLRRQLSERLPRYARPIFLRLNASIATTATFKVRKPDLVTQGYDPATIVDPLFVDDPRGGAYRPLDHTVHADIVAGAIRF